MISSYLAKHSVCMYPDIVHLPLEQVHFTATLNDSISGVWQYTLSAGTQHIRDPDLDPFSPSFWFSFFFLSYLLEGGILPLNCSSCHPVLQALGCTYSAPGPRRLSCSLSFKKCYQAM